MQINISYQQTEEPNLNQLPNNTIKLQNTIILIWERFWTNRFPMRICATL